MKPHIVIELDHSITPAQLPKLPHWQSLIENRALEASTFFPVVDHVFQKYNLPFFATQEYRPARKDEWSKDEMQSNLNRHFRLILRENTEIPEALIAEIRLLPVVRSVEPQRVKGVRIPEERSQGQSIRGYSFGQRMIYLDEAHRFSKGDPAVKIAVLDTGIDPTHPELVDNLEDGYDFVDIIDGSDEFFGDYLGADADPADELVGHGTHVAGIIAAKGLQMPMGVVPECRIIPVRVLGAMKQGEGYVGAGLVSNINVGIKWAIDQGADVINMSLGIVHSGGGLPHEAVVKYAEQKGVTMVAAAGNDGTQRLYYPGALDHVIAVGAVDENGKVASFSTYGKVTVTAPGTNVYSTATANGYAFASGTSQASPYVAGAIALMKAFAKKKGRQLSDKQIKYIIKHTSDKTDNRYQEQKSGYGRLNVIDAIKFLNYKLS